MNSKSPFSFNLSSYVKILKSKKLRAVVAQQHRRLASLKVVDLIPTRRNEIFSLSRSSDEAQTRLRVPPRNKQFLKNAVKIRKTEVS